MKKIVIITAIVAVVVVGSIFLVKWIKKRRASSIDPANAISAQADLVRAEMERQKTCSKNWLCAATQVLKGASGIIQIL